MIAALYKNESRNVITNFVVWNSHVANVYVIYVKYVH